MTEREFYVGYLKMPPGVRKFVLVLVPLLLVAAAAIGVVMAVMQDDPGDGMWGAPVHETFEGELVLAPYPLLISQDADGSSRCQLIVQEGKHGGGDIAIASAGRRVALGGHRIEREGTRMVEMTPLVIRFLSDPHDFQPSVTPLGHFHGTGQIIDPKCYLGVMKPGDGRVHKACATLCIKGGIPPMFRDDATGELYLLTGERGEVILDSILPYVSDPIAISGQVEQLADLKVLKLDVGSIKRVE